MKVSPRAGVGSDCVLCHHIWRRPESYLVSYPVCISSSFSDGKAVWCLSTVTIFTLPVPCIHIKLSVCVCVGGGCAHVHAFVRGFILACLIIINVLPGIITYPSNTTYLISLWCSFGFLGCGLDVLSNVLEECATYILRVAE